MHTPTTIPTRPLRDPCVPAPRRRGLGVVARRVAVDLTPQAVEQVAQRVTQLLAARSSQERPELLTAGELARELRVERPWVYKHRHLLGGERIGDGPKGRWLFDPEIARREMKRHQTARRTNRGL
jgi:hypothetical protein